MLFSVGYVASIGSSTAIDLESWSFLLTSHNHSVCFTSVEGSTQMRTHILNLTGEGSLFMVLSFD
jgi:hypothetical protein